MGRQRLRGGGDVTSPTQRTLAECRKLGWVAQVVEKWNPHARIRQDLFGCIDIVAVTPKDDRMFGRTIGIQACAGSSSAARVKKAMAEPRLKAWLDAGNFFEVWAWRKVGPRGKRKVWEVRITQVESCYNGELVADRKLE